MSLFPERFIGVQSFHLVPFEHSARSAKAVPKGASGQRRQAGHGQHSRREGGRADKGRVVRVKSGNEPGHSLAAVKFRCGAQKLTVQGVAAQGRVEGPAFL